MRSFSERSRSNLRGVHGDLVAVITEALQKTPYDFIVIDGLRTKREQEVLVAKGKSKTMNSRHLTGHAVDILPIGPQGPAFDWDLYHKVAPVILDIASEQGVAVEWGGNWKSFPDGPHFQLSRKAYPAGAEVSHLRPSEAEGVVELPKVKKVRENAAQSTTIQATTITGAVSVGTGVLATVSDMDPIVQYILTGGAVAVLLASIWIFRERLKKWAAGDR